MDDNQHDDESRVGNPPAPAIPDFTPVPRRVARADGWTAERQRRFIAALAAMGSVTRAAEAVGMSYSSAYALRVAPGAESFAGAWEAALARGAERVYDLLVDHAVNGVPEPIVHAGKLLGERRRFNHRTMMWVVEHHGGGKRGGGAALHGGRRRAAAEEEAAETRKAQEEAARERLYEKFERMERAYLEAVAADPEKIAAFKILHSPDGWERLSLINKVVIMTI